MLAKFITVVACVGVAPLQVGASDKFDQVPDAKSTDKPTYLDYGKVFDGGSLAASAPDRTGAGMQQVVDQKFNSWVHLDAAVAKMQEEERQHTDELHNLNFERDFALLKGQQAVQQSLLKGQQKPALAGVSNDLMSKIEALKALEPNKKRDRDPNSHLSSHTAKQAVDQHQYKDSKSEKEMMMMLQTEKQKMRMRVKETPKALMKKKKQRKTKQRSLSEDERVSAEDLLSALLADAADYEDHADDEFPDRRLGADADADLEDELDQEI